MAGKKTKAEMRNLSVFKEDLEWFDKIADYADRSRIRMFRYIISQSKAGQPVLLPVDNETGETR